MYLVCFFQVCLQMFTTDFLNQVANGLEKDSMLVILFVSALFVSMFIKIYNHHFVSGLHCNKVNIDMMESIKFVGLVSDYLSVYILNVIIFKSNQALTCSVLLNQVIPFYKGAYALSTHLY